MINEYNNLDGTWRRFLFQNFCILVKRIERVKLKRKVILVTYSFNQIAEFKYNYIHVCIVFLCICMHMKSLLWKSTTKSMQNTKDPLQSFLIYSLALKFKMADSLSVHIATPTSPPQHWSMMHANWWSSVVTQSVYESFHSVWLGPDESKRID